MTQTPLKKKTTGLGRGLSALLEDADEVQGAANPNGFDKPIGSISLIPIASIEANPFQPRTEFDIKALEELGRSAG